MAFLGKIRSQFGWLMIALVLLGVGGFLLMDATSYGGFGNGNRAAKIGTVNGIEITPQKIEDYTKEFEQPGALPEELRSYAWQSAVQEILIEQQTKKLGLTVTQKEMGELFVGEHMSYLVRREFADRQTGQINPEAIKQQVESFDNPEYLAQFDPKQQEEIKKYWANLKHKIRLDRLSSKYLGMIQKSIHTPKWLASTEYNRQNQAFDFKYVRIPYISVPNEQANVTDDELKAYIQANAKKYKREANANIEYILFDVKPTAKDSAEYKTQMDTFAAQLQTIEDKGAYCVLNGGDSTFAYLNSEEMTETVEMKDSIFKAPAGSVFGPYILENNYKVLCILKTKDLADSVRYRRILYPVNRQVQNGEQAAYQFLDSLKTLLTKGEVKFDSLAKQQSFDINTKDKGGDMGFIGRDAKRPAGMAVEDYLFFEAKKDSFYILRTQQGDLQLVQVTDYKLNGKKGLRVAFINTPIIPSENTVQSVEAQVNDFVIQNPTLDQFKKTAQDKGFRLASAGGLEINGYEISGIGKSSTAADIIQWAHIEGKEKQTAKRVFQVKTEEPIAVKQIVAVALVSKAPKGTATLDDANVRAEVDRIVRNQKKAEIVKNNLKGVASLEEVASKYGAQIEEAKSMGYAAAFIPQVGQEPKIAAVADLLEAGKMSAPIAGKEGIYVISLAAKSPAPALPDDRMVANTISQRAAQTVSRMLFEAMKEKATIKDMRSEYYQ